MYTAGINFQESYKRLQRLCDLNWTFPGDDEWSMAEVFDLASCSTREMAHAFMVEWYSEYDPGLLCIEKRLPPIHGWNRTSDAGADVRCYSARVLSRRHPRPVRRWWGYRYRKWALRPIGDVKIVERPGAAGGIEH